MSNLMCCAEFKMHGLTVAKHLRSPLSALRNAQLISSKRYTSIIAERKGVPRSEEAKNDPSNSLVTGRTAYTPPAFPHPLYAPEDMSKIHFEHRPPITFGDKMAYYTMRNVRVMFDFATGYRVPKNKQQEENPGRYKMTPEKWLNRLIFLESIAGVPGMCAGFIRHLHSLRLLRRDRAWIETLLDEAYNERMHLLTFIKIGQPGIFARSLIYVAQGIFCNGFFFSYLISPKTCHRFVGYLEEEAVRTYTHCLADIDAGKLADFNSYSIPDIAIDYWHMDPEKSTMRDLISYVRADEAKHREVNHTLANLKQNGLDRNPFVCTIEDDHSGRLQPTKGLETHKGVGWERDDINKIS